MVEGSSVKVFEMSNDSVYCLFVFIFEAVHFLPLTLYHTQLIL